MNGGKDIKIGHDKRPVSIVPSDEQFLYNIANGEVLTDEFGNPLITEVDQFFLADASKKRATSVVFPSIPTDSTKRRLIRKVGVATGTYGVNLDVNIVVSNSFTGTANTSIPITTSGVILPIEGKVLTVNSGIVSLANFPNSVEVRTIADQGGDKKYIYFAEDKLSSITKVGVGDKVLAGDIPASTKVTAKDYDRISLSNNVVVSSGSTSEKVEFFNVQEAVTTTADNVLKIAEIFRESSEVSTTLLGIDRAETQLSLFSNVSSYGLNSDEWETFSFSSGSSFGSWDKRINKFYGNRFLTKVDEITTESAITIESFPPSHSYPFGPKFAKLGLYDSNLYSQYLNFVRYGNDLYKLFSVKLASSNYSSDWISRFLDPSDVTPVGSGSAVEISYKKIPGIDNFDYAFSKIDTWTDTYRDIASGNSLKDPATGKFISFSYLKELLGSSSVGTGEIIRNIFNSGNTSPGYFTNLRRFVAIQSRRVFRYQPGRISGFTFGSRVSTEPVPGMFNEWGIANKTDQYMFKIYAGQLSIIRRSTVPLSDSVLIRNGLNPDETTSVSINGTSYDTVQPEIPSGDPFDNKIYWTIEIPRDKFNGDPLNGNGPSGYSIRPEKVTMWKIEFGWYGAIGARFYAYIPAGHGDARWIVVHTLVIENQLGQPCLEDSYFRFKYAINISDTTNIRTPQYLYKYGASYYIDGGDEGTSEQFSANSGLQPKQINRTSEAALIGVRSKDIIFNSTGVPIANRKLILPTKLNMTSDSLSEVKVKTCKACPGFGHVFTAGVKTGESGRKMKITFDSGNQITAVGSDAYFTENDIGAKIIAPSIFNAYITNVDTPLTGTIYQGPPRYESAKIAGWGPGLDGYPTTSESREIGGNNSVIDYGQINPNTNSLGKEIISFGTGEYLHEIRLSNYDVHFASKYPINGSKIEVQFVNPIPKDGISSYRGGTHWADFMIGLTDKKPTVNGNILSGWDAENLPWKYYQGSSNTGGTLTDAVSGMTTSILPNDEILFGESTHTYAYMNEDGFETGEGWSPRSPRVRMGIDSRIPSVSEPAGGRCSLATFEISPPIPLGSQITQIYGVNPETGAVDSTQGYYLKIQGVFTGGITDWVGGEVVYEDPNDPTNNIVTGVPPNVIKYEPTSKPDGSIIDSRKPITYTDTSEGSPTAGLSFSYIKISGDLGVTSNIILKGRPITLTSNVIGGVKSKLFKFNPYPLYLVGKLKDNSKINNISIKETIGENQTTTSPVLGITNGSLGTIDNASGNADVTGLPPTNFLSVKRLSSSEVDTQNQQKLRNAVTKDIFYVGANSTKEIDMTKIFGVDRNVITPDNLNVEATFLTAKKLDGNSGDTGNIQLTLNYKEQ